MSKIKHLLAHELTHYFQAKRDTIDADSENFVKTLSKKDNLKVLKDFYYFAQTHEMEALTNSAYKLYTERNTFLGDKKDDTEKRSYFRCLVHEVLEKLKMDALSKKFLTRKISLDEVCNELSENARFVLFWAAFCYAGNSKKYGNLLKKSEGLETSYRYNMAIMKENKEALYDFLKSLTRFGLSKLDNLLGELDMISLFEKLLSTTTSNKKTIEGLKKALPRNAFKDS